MAKDHADYLTDEEIKQMIDSTDFSKPDEDELERDAYFNDPANAEEIAKLFARMDMVTAMHKARQEAGLTQKQVAEKMGTKQAYIAAIERGRRNITLSTLKRYAAACGKKVSITLL